MSDLVFAIDGLGTPFPNSFEKMAHDYIYSKWSLTGNLQKHATIPLGADKKIRFKVGFPDYKKPYEINFIKIRTDAKADEVGGHHYECLTYMDVALRMKRLPRDTYVNRELNDMEEEFSRIIAGYDALTPEIAGVENLIWGGDERVYGGTDNFATSNWRSIGHFAFWYHRTWAD